MSPSPSSSNSSSLLCGDEKKQTTTTTSLACVSGVVARRLRLQEFESRLKTAFPDGPASVPSAFIEVLENMREETRKLEEMVEGTVQLPMLGVVDQHQQDDKLSSLFPLKMRTYVVHLSKKTDRKQRADGLATSAALHGASGGLWNAVDGSQLHIEDDGSMVYRDETFKVWKGWHIQGEAELKSARRAASSVFSEDWQGWRDYSRPLRAGEVGCALSHLFAWRDAARRVKSEGLEAALILEDDACGFSDCWQCLADELASLKLLQPDWDILYLGRVRAPGIAGNDGLRISSKIVHAGFSWATHAYLVSAQGLQKLNAGGLEECIMPLDEWLPSTYYPHPRRDLRQAMNKTYRNGWIQILDDGDEEVRRQKSGLCALAWCDNSRDGAKLVQAWGDKRGLMWQSLLGSDTAASSDIVVRS